MKIIGLTLCFLFIATVCYSGDVVIVYKPDKSVAIITPIRDGDIHDIVAETVIGTELEGCEYEIVNFVNLPDRSNRSGWEKEKGKPFKVNQSKVNEHNKKKQIAEKIRELNANAAKQALGI